MTHFVLSTLLSFAGVAAALAVLLAAGALVKLGGNRAPPLLCMAVSAAYGASQLAVLARQQSGLACALAPGRTVLLHGASGGASRPAGRASAAAAADCLLIPLTV